MEEIIAGVDDVKFDMEVCLEQQLGIQPLPFPGMDKSGSAICDFNILGNCARGQLCPFRHKIGDKMVVCKHWLRGLCKKGDECEFLHEYDMTKMPECYFFARHGTCSNKECPFLHIDPASKIRDCPWYDRGFCKHGPNCKHRHVRRVICVNYLCGFCPEGPGCKQKHPKFELPIPDHDHRKQFGPIICHACGEQGHKSTYCPMLLKLKEQGLAFNERPGFKGGEGKPYTHHGHPFQGKRPLDMVTCFKCRQRGHYANQCPMAIGDAPPSHFKPMMPGAYNAPNDHNAPRPIQAIQTIPTIG